MNAAELLSNSLSPGMFIPCHLVFDVAADVRQMPTRDLALLSSLRRPLGPTLSVDDSCIGGAQLTYQHGYVHTLAQEIANEQQDPNIRVAAGLALKNSVQARVSPAFHPCAFLAGADATRTRSFSSL
jgi:hypothetical protein